MFKLFITLNAQLLITFKCLITINNINFIDLRPVLCLQKRKIISYLRLTRISSLPVGTKLQVNYVLIYFNELFL